MEKEITPDYELFKLYKKKADNLDIITKTLTNEDCKCVGVAALCETYTCSDCPIDINRTKD